MAQQSGGAGTEECGQEDARGSRRESEAGAFPALCCAELGSDIDRSIGKCPAPPPLRPPFAHALRSCPERRRQGTWLLKAGFDAPHSKNLWVLKGQSDAAWQFQS